MALKEVWIVLLMPDAIYVDSDDLQWQFYTN